MRKYEEEHYLFDNIKDKIYPWVSKSLVEKAALNGKHISEKDTPLIPFVGDLMILFVIKRGEDTYEVVKDNMLPPDCDVAELYHTACSNLARDIEYVIGNTMYGAFSIFADGLHEASALCLKHIWNVCVDKLQEDLVIVAPSKDVILFAPASQEKVIEKMIFHAEQELQARPHPISVEQYVFTKEGKELLAYDKTKH